MWGTRTIYAGLMASVALGILPAAANKTEVPDKPTFVEHVAPIFNANCVQCHRPGDIAPMSLRTFDEVRPWVKSIQKNVETRVMPPWHADPKHGTFANDRRLADHEVATIVKWASMGAPRGTGALPPFPAELETEWRLGEPDSIVTFDEIEVPAGGPDQFHDLIGKYDIPEDQWVKAIEILPGNRKVVHHAIIYQTDGRSRPDGWLGAWAAGTEPMVFPEGTARVLKKGQVLVADMHYHPTDTAQTDTTRIGLHFADNEDIDKELINLWVANDGFEIPAGNPNHQVVSEFTFPQDSRILTLTPHMHYRGKDFTFTAAYPDGKEETLLHVPAYDFNWQTVYTLTEPLKVPAGTRVQCVAHFDNSPDNPVNPDPTKNVTFGLESFNEMMIGFVDYVVEDGVRPETWQEQYARVSKEWMAAHPGEVYGARMEGSDPENPAAPIYLPKSGDGQAVLRANGTVTIGKITSLTWKGESFSGVIELTPELSIPITGTRDPESGRLTYEGKGPNGNVLKITADPLQ